MLPPGDGGLPGGLAARGNEGLHRLHVGGVGRPHIGQQQGSYLAVGSVVRQRPGEVVEVAVEIDVFVRGAPNVREAVRVERMDVEHRHAGIARLGSPLGVVQRKHLHAAAAVALHPVAGAAHHQQLVCATGAVQSHVHGQHFTFTPGQRVGVGLHLQPACGGGLQKLPAGYRVGGRKGFGDTNHGTILSINGRAGGAISQAALAWAASHSSASRTQNVPPSGIRSSLKS